MPAFACGTSQMNPRTISFLIAPTKRTAQEQVNGRMIGRHSLRDKRVMCNHLYVSYYIQQTKRTVMLLKDRCIAHTDSACGRCTSSTCCEPASQADLLKQQTLHSCAYCRVPAAEGFVPKAITRKQRNGDNMCASHIT